MQAVEDAIVTPEQVDEFAERWFDLKRRERELRDERWELEERMADRVGKQIEGKSELKGNHHKVTLHFRVRRVLNEERWRNLRDQVPERQRPIRTKLRLDKRRYFRLVENRPELAKIVRQAVDIRPSKVSVKVTQT